MKELFKILTLILPILIPGLFLIFILKSKWLRFLDIPIDLRKSLNNKRIFGDNKTIKGIFVLTTSSIIVSLILKIGIGKNLNLFIHPIFTNQPIIIGLTYSISYMTGELINSFVKRRLEISAGQLSKRYNIIQRFFDLSDGIIVTVIILTIFKYATPAETMLAGLLGIVLHFLTDVLMKKIQLK
jgi:hypothetical protein